MASAGWRLPVRSGTLVSPSITAPIAEASAITAASCMATSTRWPWPVRSRWTSAPRMPAQRWMPARKSQTAAPALVGGPSAWPVALVMPLIAWMVTSMAARSR